MTNKEVIEVLEKEESYMLSHGGDRQAKALRIAIDKIEQEPRWIPVKERLPEESTAVLVWCPERKNIYCAYYKEKHWWVFGAYWEEIKMEITAWMPLSQSYKKEQEPMLDKPHIKGDYYDGFKNGLRTAEWRYNKIRTAIKKLPITDTAIWLVDEIFDTYMEESESKK